MLGGSYAEGGSTSSSGPASSTDRGSADDPAASSSTGLFARAKTAIRTRLEAQGLTKGDVAKIGGLFLAAKYSSNFLVASSYLTSKNTITARRVGESKTRTQLAVPAV